MGVYKDKNRGNWYVSYRYVDSFGNRKRKYHRGFRTRAEAQAWEREDRLKEEFSTSMTLGKFYELYEKDVKHRVKENTWNNKEYIVKSKILPYFGEMPLSQITPRTIRHWQNEIMQEVDENGKKAQAFISCNNSHPVKLHIKPCSKILWIKNKCGKNGRRNGNKGTLRNAFLDTG